MKNTQYQPKTGAKCGCRRGIQRDNCPNCEGTGYVIDFAAIRARNTPPTQPEPDLSAFDSSEYDTEAMRMDASHGNFSPDRAEDYRHENIVRASLENGQFIQAKTQCAEFGLDYDTELHKFKSA
jgi:hypothetical protein